MPAFRHLFQRANQQPERIAQTASRPMLLMLGLLVAATVMHTVSFAQTRDVQAVAGTPTRGQANKNPLTTDPGMLYQQYCSVCHGENGDGLSRARRSLSPPPLDFTDPRWKPRLTRERMIRAVKHGLPGTAMVGWKTQLDDRRIESIVDHVLSRFVKLEPTKANRPDPLPAVSTGQSHSGPKHQPSRHNTVAEAADVNSGGQLYMANCVACHGALGDGNGPRAYFINPPPRNFLTEQSRRIFTRPVLSAAISHGKTGTEMPAWNKVLNDQQIADITEYVLRQYIERE